MNIPKKHIKRIVKSESKKAEMFRFILVGGSMTLLQYAIYIIFLEVIRLTPVVCTMISYAISFVVNFILTSYFTFQSDPNAKKGLGFTLSHLINMGLQVGLVAVFKGIVGKTLALLPALLICLPVNFLLVRFVFTHRIFQSTKEKTVRDLI